MIMRFLLIDSSIYKAECFKFDKGLLNYISKLCQQGKIELLYNDIIYREVLCLMKEKCMEFNHNFSSALKAINFLSDEEEIKVLSNFKKDNLNTLAKIKLDKYLNSCKAISLEQNINIKAILDDYFESRAPFGSGDKKAEFPDAIILQMLENKKFKDSDNVFVLSTDKDWAKFCANKEKYIFFDDIYKCIVALSSSEDQNMLYDEQLYNWIIKDDNLNEINNLLESELFQNFDVGNIIDDNTEITDNNSSISLIIDPQCVYFDKENGILDFDISFITNVDFVTDGLDYDNAYYDKEDDKYYNLNRIMLHYTGEVQGYAVISLNVTFKEKHHIRINKINHTEIFQDEINNSKENINVEKIDLDYDEDYY